MVNLNYRKVSKPVTAIYSDHYFCTDADYATAERVALQMHFSQKFGLYGFADPTSWKCSEKFCDHWRKCRGNSVSPAPIGAELDLMME